MYVVAERNYGDDPSTRLQDAKQAKIDSMYSNLVRTLVDCPKRDGSYWVQGSTRKRLIWMAG